MRRLSMTTFLFLMIAGCQNSPTGVHDELNSENHFSQFNVSIIDSNSAENGTSFTSNKYNLNLGWQHGGSDSDFNRFSLGLGKSAANSDQVFAH